MILSTMVVHNIFVKLIIQVEVIYLGQNASYWEKISGLTRDRGNWSSSTAYQVNDIVTYIHEYAYNSCWKYYDTSTYICRQAHTNNNPATALPYR